VSISPSADKVIILDRDGTLVVDRGYLGDPAGLELEPGAAEGLQLFTALGYRLIVITNQSGVGRGFFTLGQLQAMNARLSAMVDATGAHLERIYSCPHAPNENCDCRKPALGLLRQAVAELGFNPTSAVVIGDKETDIEFGRRVGATTVLISQNASAASMRAQPDFVVANLIDAARAVTSRGADATG